MIICTDAVPVTPWWCNRTPEHEDGRCRQCHTVAAWLATGADPDTMPSFLRPDGDL